MIGSLLAIFSHFFTKPIEMAERTFIMLKPDAGHRCIIGEIITRFEKRGYKLVGMKFMNAPRSVLEEHYAEHKGRPFYEGLVNYMASGPVCPMVWEGTEVIATARRMIGETKPIASAPGTIRGDYGIDVGRVEGQNVEKGIKHGCRGVEKLMKFSKETFEKFFEQKNLVHGSDGKEAADREIKLWFKDDELTTWTPSASPWIYE